jgi:hypothetical protein
MRVVTSSAPRSSSAAAPATKVATDIPVLARLLELPYAFDRELEGGGVVPDWLGVGVAVGVGAVGVVVLVGDGDGGGPVTGGAGFTMNWTWYLSVPRALVAITLKNVVPTVVGTPETVAVFGSKLRPAGNGVVGSMPAVGTGCPVTVNWKA